MQDIFLSPRCSSCWLVISSLLYAWPQGTPVSFLSLNYIFISGTLQNVLFMFCFWHFAIADTICIFFRNTVTWVWICKMNSFHCLGEHAGLYMEFCPRFWCINISGLLNEAPQAECLQIVAIYFFIDLKARTPKLRCQQGHAPSGTLGRRRPCLFQLLVLVVHSLPSLASLSSFSKLPSCCLCLCVVFPLLLRTAVCWI